MRKTLLVGGLAALTLAAAGGVAVAQQAPARAMRADTDGDSRLSRAEFVGQRVQRLTEIDADHDGSVSADERRAGMQARMAGRADARFDRLDADNDGAVTRAEFDAARAMRGDHRAGRGARVVRAHRGAGRGGHGMNGQQPVVIAEVQARAEQAFARLDSDRDGFVSAAESRAGRQAMREQRRQRMAERRARHQASPPAPASE